MEREPGNLVEAMESIEIKEKLEQFKEELETAADCVREFDSGIFLSGLGTYDALGEHQAKAMEILLEEFGFDVKKSNESLVKQYSISGEPDTAGQGDIRVTVFKTTDPEVFIGKYEYTDGDIVWSLRPEEHEE